MVPRTFRDVSRGSRRKVRIGCQLLKRAIVKNKPTVANIGFGKDEKEPSKNHFPPSLPLRTRAERKLRKDKEYLAKKST